ncbi:MAG: nitrogenase component 1 [Opitutaceae bacterium]|jgi:nitrogenase molybdenum-iron protein NifN
MIAPPEAFSKCGEGVEPYPNATTNACKLCTPLGACLAFRGVAGAIPFLHGSQGCATYIRRYLISHFREPMDIAASNFSESSTVFGGGANLRAGLANVLRQYEPALIGLATTCLSETIGEDLPGHLREFNDAAATPPPPIVTVSTASFRGTHADGFHSAVRAIVASLAATNDASQISDLRSPISEISTEAKPTSDNLKSQMATAPVALFPGMVSPADLRELKHLVAAMQLPLTLLPDYSDTLDGPSWADYEKLPAGGTTVEAIRALGYARASLEFGRVLAGAAHTAGTFLAEKHGVPLHRLGLPIGLRETDRFLEKLSALSGQPIPPAIEAERGRLIDSWVDGHKYVFEKRAIVYGEEDVVVGLVSLLTEIGIVPMLCASGGRSGRFAAALRAAVPELDDRTVIRQGADFADIAAVAAETKPDFLIGSSKGYSLARQLEVPLIRCDFPIHDRIGGQRVLHVGYAGAQALFDRIVNTLLDRKQGLSPIGYSYL